MSARPRLFLYALLAFGGISFLSFLWDLVPVPEGVRDGLQILLLFALGGLLVPLSLREFRTLRADSELSPNRRNPLLLMAVAAAAYLFMLTK